MESVRSTGGQLLYYIRLIIGEYTPLQDQSTGEYIQTMAGVDWEYIIAAVIFILVLYFVLKYITLLFKR